MGMGCSGSRTVSSRWSPGRSPAPSAARAARRDRGRPPARGRQQRADPLPRPAAGAQPSSTSSSRRRPRAAGAVLLDAGRRAGRAAPRPRRRRAAYVFHRPGDDRLRRAEDDLTTGRFRVRSAAQAKVTPAATPPTPRYAAPRAVLEVNGMQHPLEPPGLVVGRGTEADLRINDPGCQPPARRVPDLAPATRRRPQVSVVDLGSTNGILVDGHKVRRPPSTTAPRSRSATPR